MIKTCSAADEMWNISHDEMELLSPAAAHMAAAGEEGDPLQQHEVDEVAKRRWKAEQANKALWAFGGRVRQVQQGWKRQQDEAKRAPKRHKPAQHTTTHSGPLLLLNQLYWEQHLGTSIHSITEDNMFGINMFGSYRSICQNMLNSNSNAPAAAAADSQPQNSSSSCNKETPVCNSNKQTVPDAYTLLQVGTPDRMVGLQRNPQLLAMLKRQQQKQKEQQQEGPQQYHAVDKDLQDDANSAVSADGRGSSSGSGSGSDHSSATPAPATPMMGLHGLHEIEAVCRQQQLMHLPANRRFVKAVRFLQAAKQQQQQLQQQQQ